MKVGIAFIAACTVASLAATAQERAPQPAAEWQRKYQMGVAHRTAWDLYQDLKAAAHGGRQNPTFAQLPDWSGLWTASGGGDFFTPGPGGVAPKLRPAAAATLKEGRDLAARGIVYDENLSDCGPPGFPRWLVIPFLREFIVRPEQTWLSSETVNNVRRIYTDGRDHLSPADRFPTYYGDSIGFWDGPKLVVHTTSLMDRSMGRSQPRQSEQMETVEVWEKIDARTIVADAWIYDPTLYVEPWHLQRRYAQMPNADKVLRLNYWNCNENPNNDVYKTPDGNTQYRDFTFTTGDDRKEQGR
ncbi:MAG: hypothetical protein HY824_00240 [Acidobacteria bacterium]|nr:hypothetical protein [Acidobacteriota bacterium]